MALAPNRFHQEIALNIVLPIANYLKSRPVGKIFIAPLDVYLNDANVYQPDLVFIASDNYGVLTDAGVEGAPDLIIEIWAYAVYACSREITQPAVGVGGLAYKLLWPQESNA